MAVKDRYNNNFEKKVTHFQYTSQLGLTYINFNNKSYFWKLQKQI